MCDSRKYTFGEKLVAIATDELRGTKWQTRRPRESGKSADFKFLLWWNQATLDKTYVIVECIGHLSIDWYLTYIEIGGSIFRYSDRSFVRLRHGAPVRRGGSQPAAGAAQNLARCDILREQPGRRPARDCVKRRTAAGPACATAIVRSVITYFCLLSISDGAFERSGEVSVGGVTDGTDRYEYFVVLNEIFAYASIEIFRWARRFAHVNGSSYRIFCGSLLNGFFLCGQLTHVNGVSVGFPGNDR